MEELTKLNLQRKAVKGKCEIQLLTEVENKVKSHCKVIQFSFGEKVKIRWKVEMQMQLKEKKVMPLERTVNGTE
jgi:hypothetical protein